jgi:alpha-L-rhamnosidase
MRPRPVIPLVLIFILVGVARLAASDMRVGALRCEFAIDPMGMDVAQPRLSWIVTGDVRGQKQTAWQVLVASSAESLGRDMGDLWDSGRISSDQTSGVRYAGAAIPSSERVFWKVRSWDKDGSPTPWSQAAAWTMGILSPGEWRAEWITALFKSESLLLRREFNVRPGLRRALANVSGLGQYELDFNGQKAGDDFLSPGWTDYDKTTLYETRDVTSLLHAGANAAGLMLGNGMYDVEQRGRYIKFAQIYGPLRAILSLRLEYADGTVETVGTDTTWRVLPGPITEGNAYDGEDYDARLEPPGWNRAGFDDSRWPVATEFGAAGEKLRGVSASDEPVRVIESRVPVSQWTLADGSTVYDLGQNASMIPRIRVAGPAGSTVRLIPSEVINPDGTPDRETTGAGVALGSSWWQYTKATDGDETWEPRFCYIGCRYLVAKLYAPGWLPPPILIDQNAKAPTPGATMGMLPKVVALEGLIVHSTAAPVGGFATSNELLNRIRTLIRWAQRSNMVSVLTDCPHREKLGWLEQYHQNGPSFRYEFDVDRIFQKGVNDMADAQHADGLVPNIAPEYAKFDGIFRAAAEWGSAFMLVPWQQYEFTGDVELFRSHFAAMKAYYAYLETKADDGIISEGLGDWFDLGPKRPGHAQLTQSDVTATAFMFEDARILGKVAEVLGRTEDAKDYTARSERVRETFNRRFYHPQTGSYADDTQCANALALALNIVEPADRNRVLGALVRDIERHGYSTTAGDVGFRYVLQALAKGGRSDLIYRMVNQDTKPGYGYQLRMGATSLTESWDANRHSSQNHFMLGEVIEWFYRDLAGIDHDPASPGFKNVVIRPQPVGDLSWVAASYDSIHGPITVRWERRGERFLLKTSVPANTTATVYVPSTDGDVTEGEGRADRSPGVTLVGRLDDRSIYTVQSGSYEFESFWRMRPQPPSDVPAVPKA